MKRVWFVAFLVAGCGEDIPEGEPASDRLDDDFDDNLSDWEILNPDQAQTRVAEGLLQLEPAAGSLWFNERAGTLVHKLVSGDFVATASVTARRLSDPGLPPEPMFRLGGLMARHPVPPSGESYVFIVVGADGDDVSVETKTTVDGTSEFDGPAWPSAAGELRICRLGDSMRLLIRDLGGTWVEQANFDRPDLPGTLMVGPMGYANNGDPDLRVTFDFVRFSEPQSPDDCL